MLLVLLPARAQEQYQLVETLIIVEGFEFFTNLACLRVHYPLVEHHEANLQRDDILLNSLIIFVCFLPQEVNAVLAANPESTVGCSRQRSDILAGLISVELGPLVQFVAM